MAVTIKDVAALAGVSPSTVSRVCNNNPSISRETRARVLEAMAQLGYEAPSSGVQPGRALPMVGVVLPPAPESARENSFYLEAIHGVCNFCSARGAISTVIAGADSGEVLGAVKNLSQSGMADSFILLYSMQNDPVEEYLCEQGLLYVIVGKPNHLKRQTICIDNDNLLAGREAADYLFGLGHRRIGYLGCRDDYGFAADRKTGYQLSMMQHGLAVHPHWCLETDGPLTDDDQPLMALLSPADRPTAFVVSDDILAASLERACRLQHIAIPEDLSIVSFNNSLFARLSSPQLTSIDVNAFQLGYEAACQAFNHAENPNLMATKIIVPHQLIIRHSCRALSQDGQ